MQKNRIAIILGIVCMLLTIGICVQIKTIDEAKLTIGTTLNDNSELKDEVLRWKERYDNVYRELENTEERLEQVRKKATENNQESSELEKELKNSNKLLGLTELKGQGVIVTLDDNREVTLENIASTANISDFLIHDGDIIEVINELKNAGAQAISVNDQRVVSTTGVVCDGNVVRINGQKIGAPFVIKAIGFPESLYNLERPEGYLQRIRRGGAIAEIEKSEDITIPKFTGIFSHEYIK